MTNPATRRRPCHLPWSLRFDNLPLGRASIWDAKGYSLISNVRRDIAQEVIDVVNQSAAFDAVAEAAQPFAEIACLENFDDDQGIAPPVVVGDVRRLRAALTQVEELRGQKHEQHGTRQN